MKRVRSPRIGIWGIAGCVRPLVKSKNTTDDQRLVLLKAVCAIADVMDAQVVTSERGFIYTKFNREEFIDACGFQ